MQLGMVGLGRMGGNMVRRLLRAGHQCVVSDLSPQNVNALAGEGATGSASLDDFVAKLKKPRAAWIMVPAGDPTEQTVNALAQRFEPGDIIIDGGNSYYKDDVRRSQKLKDIPRTPGREKLGGTAEQGYVYCGPSGAGHFVKMVHNGIEYGLMQAYAEGFDIFRNASSEQLPEGHRYDLNLPDIAEVWRRGSVVSSWLLDLTAMALAENPTLSEYTGVVQDSGEGRWTVNAALEEAVPADVLTAAVYTRFRSRQEHTFAEKMLSAMRQKFGGHIELTQKKGSSF
jgi:6-phosphogluconate dehydrogenase